MANGHFSTAGAYRVDPKTAFYRQQDEDRRLQERVARAAHWFSLRVVDKRFDSIEQLRSACVALAETLYGGQMDDETAEVVSKAVTTLWLGRVQWALFREPIVRAEVTEEPHTVRFVVAA